jgi:hypothetical protein
MPTCCTDMDFENFMSSVVSKTILSLRHRMACQP